MSPVNRIDPSAVPIGSRGWCMAPLRESLTLSGGEVAFVRDVVARWAADEVALGESQGNFSPHNSPRETFLHRAAHHSLTPIEARAFLKKLDPKGDL